MNPHLYNAHLEGEAFFWEGNQIGILLLHGFTATPAEVRPLARNLFEAGYTVAGPVLAGHATTPDDLNRTRFEDWIASAEEGYQALRKRCRKVFVGGASMGGMVALWLAADHPEIAGVIGFAPAVKLTTPTWRVAVLTVAAPFIKQISRSSLDNPQKWQGYPDLPLKGAVQVFRMQKALRRRFTSIHQPVLVFQGRKDRTVAPEAGEIICGGVASADKKVHWLERSTHEVTLDEELPEVTRLVIDFIKRYGEND